jgi:hypothetical protein
MAAIYFVHRNINGAIGIPNNEKAAGTGGLRSLSADKTAYSAACLRGGSSAPESWISATW